MTPRRAAKLKRAVEAGLGRWPPYGIALHGVSPPEPHFSQHHGSIVRSMPRRKPFHAIDETNFSMPMARRVRPRAGIGRPLARLGRWSLAVVQFLSEIAFDWICGQGSPARRAVRLRQTFERLGVSFIKVGQQLSIRADLLPYVYCAELGKMLDRAEPFPTAQAVAI